MEKRKFNESEFLKEIFDFIKSHKINHLGIDCIKVSDLPKFQRILYRLTSEDLE